MRIPIAEAMRLTVERGLPSRPRGRDGAAGDALGADAGRFERRPDDGTKKAVGNASCNSKCKMQTRRGVRRAACRARLHCAFCILHCSVECPAAARHARLDGVHQAGIVAVERAAAASRT